VQKIRCEGGRVRGIELESGEAVALDAVVSNHGGVGTHELVVGASVDRSRSAVEGVKLQSPGGCAYLAV